MSLGRSKLIPREVLASAARETGVLGESPKSSSAIAALSDRLTAWYKANGYIYASVPSRLRVEDGHLVLLASEPRAARLPVCIEFFSPVDAPPAPPPPDHGRLTSVRRSLHEALLLAATIPREPPLMRERYRDAAAPARIEAAIDRARRAGVRPASLHRAEESLASARRSCGVPLPTQFEALARRGQLVRCSGTTRGDAVARMLGLRPGEPWRLNPTGWARLAQSELFDLMDAPRILRVAPGDASGVADAPLGGGTGSPSARGEEEIEVLLQVVERGAKGGKPARFRALEPSVSLSRGRITGEVGLEDANWRGANQRLSARLARANASEVSVRLHVPAAFSVSRAARDGRGSLLTVGGGDGTIVSSDIRGFWRPARPEDTDEPRGGVSCLLSGISRALGGAVAGGQISADLVPVSRPAVPVAPPAHQPPPSPNGRTIFGRTKAAPPPQAKALAPAAHDQLPVVVEGRLTTGSLRSAEAIAEADIVCGGAPARLRQLVTGAELRLAHALPLADRCPDFWRLSWRLAASAPLIAPPPPAPPPPTPVAALNSRRERVAFASATQGDGAAISAARSGVPEGAGLLSSRSPPDGAAAAAQAGGAGGVNASLARLLWGETALYAGRMAGRARMSLTGRGQLVTAGAPEYEYQGLGGDGSVRGYEPGELGSGLNTVRHG